MTVPTPATPVPQPSLGLTPSDPTTQIMGLAALIALLVKAVPSLAGWSVNPLFPAVTIVAAALIVVAGIVSKHGLTGRQKLADAMSELAAAWREAQSALPVSATLPLALGEAIQPLPVVPQPVPKVLTPNP